MTPAQASPGSSFVTDVPVQGPTDEGLRASDCWQAQNILPARPACADCKGPIPMWAQRSLSFVRGQGAGIGGLSLGGVPVPGFGIGAMGDPDIWTKLSPAQQTWVMNTLVALNDRIVKNTGTTCATWGPSITAAGGCFQAWWNSSNISPKKIRTDGVFDEETLCALITVAGIYSADFPTRFPDPANQYCQIPTTTAPAPAPTTTAPAPAPAPLATAPKKLSTGAMVGIGIAGAAALGGVGYFALRSAPKGKKKTKKKARKTGKARKAR